jgi:hypothetical protein
LAEARMVIKESERAREKVLQDIHGMGLIIFRAKIRFKLAWMALIVIICMRVILKRVCVCFV